ncbi:MAG: DUF2752 domain-containing protein [Ilumatobacteraceae bacterium]
MHAASSPIELSAPGSPGAALPRAGLLGRIAPVACGCALAATAGIVARFDPAAANSRFPACQFRAITGLWCPGCGLTRGFHQLFNGHVLSALSYNVFIPLVLVAVVGAWWSWLRTSWGRPGIRWPRRAMRLTIVWLPVAIVVYGVLRNIPAAPFTALAP